MRRTRIFSVIVFVIAVVAFGVFQFRERVLTDQSGPSITMEEESITVSVDADEAALLEGISAVDKKDGDVTDSLMVESLSNFTAKNTRTLTFAASDSDGHVVKGKREIVYSDYESPRFSLENPLQFQVGVDNILEDVRAKDLLDGDVTTRIKISNDHTLTADEEGEYPMEFTVANSAGDIAKLPVTVTIYTAEEKSKQPQIELSDYLVYTPVGKELDLWDYVEKITLGGNEFERTEEGSLRTESGEEVYGQISITEDEVSIEEDVDYHTPGTYEVTYQFTYEFSEQEDRTGEVRLIVVVTD